MGQKGFTFIELIVTVAILAILAAVIIPISELTVKRDKELELRRTLRTIRGAIDAYKEAWDDGHMIKKAGESGYPPTLMVLVEGVEDAKSKEGGVVLKFLRRIPRDPMADKADYISNEETWGLRSYKSSHEDPAEGDDVFDVYSLSDGKAIDGTLYEDW